MVTVRDNTAGMAESMLNTGDHWEVRPQQHGKSRGDVKRRLPRGNIQDGSLEATE